MYMPVPYAQRTQTDRVPPENFPRVQLDRHIYHVNALFFEGFDPNRTPVQSAVDRARSAGSVALLDVGCGTGNTLRTWMLATRQALKSPVPIDATGISLHDYHTESTSQRTQTAVESGDINYLVGDAVDHLDGLRADGHSVDVALAFNSLIHMRPSKADAVLGGVLDLLSPNGVVLFNLSEEQCVSDSLPMERMYRLEDAGYETDIRTATLMLGAGPYDYKLGYIKKPGD